MLAQLVSTLTEGFIAAANEALEDSTISTTIQLGLFTPEDMETIFIRALGLAGEAVYNTDFSIGADDVPEGLAMDEIPELDGDVLTPMGQFEGEDEE